MAEPIAMIAGPTGFISIMTQIARGINDLRELRRQEERAPEILEDVTRELSILREVIADLETQFHDCDKTLLQHCEESCGKVANHLNKLRQLIGPNRMWRGRQIVRDLFRPGHLNEEMEILSKSIQNAKSNVIM